MDNLTRSTQTMMDAAINAHLPLMLVGAPGTGKTATVKAIARERGYEIITLVGSRMDPTDVTGLPKGELVGTDADGKDIFATVNLSPWWQVAILQKKKVILFLDEWGNSPGAVQAAFLTLLQDREFPNGHRFPDETVVIGAMNPPEEGADSYEMALPTTNRIFWINWSPTTESWIEGMRSAWGKEVSDAEKAWKTKVSSFIRDNPTWLHRPPTDSPTVEVHGVNANDASGMTVYRSAWASRRSWDNLSRVLAEAPNDVFIQDTIANGVVGYAASGAFRDWLRKHDNISPADVIADPESVDWKEIKLDDANLVLRSIVEMIDADNSLDVLRVFEVVADQDRANIGGPFMRDVLLRVTNKDFGTAVVKKHQEAARKLLPKYSEVTKNSTGARPA